MRVLFSFGWRYACFGNVLSAALRDARPGPRVKLATRRAAEGAVARFRPHLVISDVPVAAPGVARISTTPTAPSTLRAGGVVRTVVNPSSGDLLDFVDKVGKSAGGMSRPGA